MNATAGPAPPDLRLSGVTLRFDGQPLFERLDLELGGGRCTCLLGPSGVGKSSLLKFIAGLLPAAAAGGTIETADGKPPGRRIAYMAQQDLLLPWLNLLDNVTLGYRLRGQQPPTERARRLLARVGLGGAERQLPATLSGGMRQRAALARTLLEDRPVVLLDEPFSALDAITRYRLQALAAELLAGRTVLLVTHDPLEALRLGHTVYVLGGRPARLQPPLVPAGPPPRDPGDARLPELHGELLRQLAYPSEPCAVP